ncbi:MAG: ABC transporter ATP-binding protein, partial [Acidimicrobiia bacterium]|nr:ABC transporter ATP-binding protein [Acidimicrobiia bacterium]
MSWGVTDLGVDIAGEPAISGVNLDIVEGTISAVVGGDGAGKTTLARVLGRLIPHERGDVRIPPWRQVGYQPASSGSWPDLTVMENLRFVADAHHLKGDDRSQRFDVLLDSTGLGAATDRLAADLSGGMRQKLGVAMALVSQPKLLVLDEPTTGVDPVSRAELWRLISRSAAEGTAVVMTTTYLDEAERAARILALEAGKTLAEGSPETIGSHIPG